MPKKVKSSQTAISKITAQTKKQISRIRETAQRQYRRDSIRIDQRKAREIAKLDATTGHLPHSVRKELRDQIRLKAREAKATAKSKAKTAADIEIYNRRMQATERKATVKKAAKIYANESGTSYKQAIKKSPKKLESFAKITNKKYRKPTKKDFQKIQDEGRLGRGLDYFIPFDYNAYLQTLDAARKTGILHNYMIYLSTIANGTVPVKSALYSKSLRFDETLPEDELMQKAMDKYLELMENYQYDSLYIDGYVLHFTVRIKRTA